MLADQKKALTVASRSEPSTQAQTPRDQEATAMIRGDGYYNATGPRLPNPLPWVGRLGEAHPILRETQPKLLILDGGVHRLR